MGPTLLKPERSIGIRVAVLCTALALATLAVGKKKPATSAAMAEPQRAMHALNRLAFGPRLGDVQRVTALGVDQWVEIQLHPEKIDDSALDARLAELPTLRMSPQELVEHFPSRQIIKGVVAGRIPLPKDPADQAVYEAQIKRYQEAVERKQQAAQIPAAEADPAKENRPDLDRAEVNPADPKSREALPVMRTPRRQVDEELVEAKLLRDASSERQLEAVMTDFWFNHFNVFLNKGADRYFVTSYEREVIRPRALGKFEDLLVATARNPAMLFYLDNWLSVGPNSDFARGVSKNAGFNKRRPRKAGPGKRRGGLNENYAREIMELHTLGVNGGYTQNDVTEVARVLTGWTIERPQLGGRFLYDARLHEPGDKQVLGKRIKNNGEKEGREVLHMLAHHPSTARFISTKLAMRFVSDTPPPALVDRMTKVFLRKDGDIREVLRTLFQSPEFWAPEAYRAKVKTPLEFAVSAIRSTGAQIEDTRVLARALKTLGMPLYAMQPPTGYSMKAETWVNSAALLGRLNLALALGSGRLRGVQFDPQSLASPSEDAAQLLTELENTLLAGDVSQQTHETIAKQMQDPQVTGRRLDDPVRPPNVGVLTGLLLGSPEFQKR